MVLSMPKVMLQMIALGFEDIVIFIFGFPSASASADDLRDASSGEVVVCDKCIGVKHFAIGF